MTAAAQAHGTPPRSKMAPPRTGLPLSFGGGSTSMPSIGKKTVRRAAGLLLLPAAALLFRGEDFPPRQLLGASVDSTKNGGQRVLDDGLGGDPMPPVDAASLPCDRRLQAGDGQPCTPKTPYVHLDEAKSRMPRIDRSIDRQNPPTSVRLCRELLQRDELRTLSTNAAATGQSVATARMELFEAEEHVEMCVDWTSPHAALMEMFASAVIAAAGSTGHGLRYAANCARTGEHTLRGGMEFDSTTIQQALPESGLIIHPHSVEVEAVKQLCRGCLSEWDDGPGRLEEGGWGRGSHQCVLFPDPNGPGGAGRTEGGGGGGDRPALVSARMDDAGPPAGSYQSGGESSERGGGGGTVDSNGIPPSEDGNDYDDYGGRKLKGKVGRVLQKATLWSSGGEGEVGERGERRPEPEGEVQLPGSDDEEEAAEDGGEPKFAARSEGDAPQQVTAAGGSAQALQDQSGGDGEQEYPAARTSKQAMGGAAALRAILPTIRDRLRFAAIDYYPKTGPHPDEPESGAVIYLDPTSVVVPFYVYTSHIPPFVTSVHVLAGAECARAHLENGEACVEHGRKLRHYLSVFYPQAHVRFDLAASTAASYSRMVLAKMLMCPPGTPACLLPALAKPEGTAAVMVESSNRESTYHWFDALQQTGDAQHVDAIDLDHIEVVTVDEADTAGGTATAGGDFESTLLKDPPLRSEGCGQIRGKMGEWVPEDLNANPALKGLVKGIMMRGASRYQEERAEKEGKRRPKDAGEVTFGGGDGEARAFKWVETAFPTCQMDELTLPGLCAAAETLGISRIFFLGDVLQGQMVLSLWTLLGLPDYPGHKTMGAWNRVVDCPEPLNSGRSFEIAFARNDDLDDNQRIDVSPSHANYPWIKDYLSGGADPTQRTLLVASTGAYVPDFDRFRRSLDKFAHSTLDGLRRPDDLVFYRTSAPGHGDCEEVDGARTVLTEEQFVRYNNAAMEEFHNRERNFRKGKSKGPEFVQASWSAAAAQPPQGEMHQQPQGPEGAPEPQPRTAKHGVQVLDVFHMTIRHPDGAPAPPADGAAAAQSAEGAPRDIPEGVPQDRPIIYKPKEVHDCAHEYRPGPPDAWNHMLYTKLVDLAQEFKEHQRRHHIW